MRVGTIANVGIVGVGRMGTAMWRCLHTAGIAATVHDTHAPAAAAVAAEGAPVAASAAALADAVDTIIVSLPTSADVDSVVAQVAPSLRAGTLLIDTTSGEPAASRKIGADVAAVGAQYLDAGVSGGPLGARAGTLKIMVGGDADAFARAQPVLHVLGAHVWHCGPTGSGHPRQAAEILELRTWGQFLLGPDGRKPFGFALDLAVKDWGVAAGVATSHKVPMPIASAAMQSMRAMRAQAGPDADLMEAVAVVEEWSGYDLEAALGRRDG